MNSSHHNPKSLRTKFALRFLRALRNINHQDNNNNKKKKNTQKRYHKVKVAAESSMASAVGPSRAWSRAVLSRIRARPAGTLRRRMRRRRQGRAWNGPEHQAQAQSRPHEQLRRLVPGGEAMDLQRLFDETAHYIKCLSTQVKVMRTIVNYCSPSSSSPTPS